LPHFNDIIELNKIMRIIV